MLWNHGILSDFPIQLGISSSQLTFVVFRGLKPPTSFLHENQHPAGRCRWLNCDSKWEPLWCHWQMSTSPNDLRAMKNGPFIDDFITYINIMVCLAIKHQLLKCQRVFQKIEEDWWKHSAARLKGPLVDPVPIHVGSLMLEPYPKVAADKNIWIYLYYIYIRDDIISVYYIIYIYCTHILCTYMYT